MNQTADPDRAIGLYRSHRCYVRQRCTMRYMQGINAAYRYMTTFMACNP
jgi:hypothetical protein